MRRLIIACSAFATALGASTAAYSESVENLIRRYPYDPACAWGRIGNGKGMIVRCLTEQEASALARAAEAAPAASSAPPSTTAEQSPAPSASADPEPDAPSSSSDFAVTVGPVVADKGTLSLGKVDDPKDRYKKCVLDHGGLKGKSGEVQVRFLVRTQGIAEGVTVHKRMNVSSEAARCVADIVDRRRLSVPDEPMVGATVFIKFNRGE